MNKKQLSGFFASVLALLAAWGIYRPSPGPSPTPGPTPVATASPAPSASPTPAPTVLPTPSPVVDLCANFVVTSAVCRDRPHDAPLYRMAVEAAQDQARANGFVVGDYVTGEKAYTQEVARLLREQGFHATACGLPDEVWVAGAGMSEHYDIVTSELMVWNHFAAKCEPEKWREK